MSAVEESVLQAILQLTQTKPKTPPTTSVVLEVLPLDPSHLVSLCPDSRVPVLIRDSSGGQPDVHRPPAVPDEIPVTSPSQGDVRGEWYMTPSDPSFGTISQRRP